MNGQDSATDGKWHTVTVKPRHTSDRPQEAGKKPKVSEVASSGGRVEGNDSAFSALDNWYSDQQRQQHQKPSVESEEEASGSVSSEDDHRLSADAAKHAVSGQPKKAKKPKVRRPKVKPAQAASGLDVSKYKELLATVQQTYPDNELSQLQTVADQLLESFQASELPFNKLLSEQPVDKVAWHIEKCSYRTFCWAISQIITLCCFLAGHRCATSGFANRSQEHPGDLCCQTPNACGCPIYSESFRRCAGGSAGCKQQAVCTKSQGAPMLCARSISGRIDWTHHPDHLVHKRLTGAYSCRWACSSSCPCSCVPIQQPCCCKASTC